MSERPVVMVGTISGTRDGADWPTRGQAIVLPDPEAAALVGNGMARELTDGETPVFPAAPAPLETAEDTTPAATGELTPPPADPPAPAADPPAKPGKK